MDHGSHPTEAPEVIERPGPERLDPTVKALGVVTLLNDLSSEVTIRTLPLFLANVLGIKTGIIGLIEGIAESTSTLLQVVSGYLADRTGKKRQQALLGYGLSAFTKPLLYFATGWGLVLAVRVLDRIGKSVRTPPRDALIADVTSSEQRGRAFGFNKAMDKMGAVVGLLLAAVLVFVSQERSVTLTRAGYQMLVLLAVVPGLAAVLVLALVVKERSGAPPLTRQTVRLAWAGFDGRFRAYLAIIVCFTLGNSSDAFLMLRAQTLGLGMVEIFLMLAAFSAVISLSAPPAGALSDLVGRRALIVLGWSIYAAIYLGFAVASTRWHLWVLYLGYGLYYGAFQGAASALVADLVPRALRGTAYGLFNAAVGVAALPASVLAGLLWQWFGPPAPFVVGGSLALLAAILLMLALPRGVSTEAPGSQG
jgi:MFS family permease